MDKIKTTFHNNVRSVLRPYLYQLQPRDLVTKARLPSLLVEVDKEEYTFNFEVRDMTRPEKSLY